MVEVSIRSIAAFSPAGVVHRAFGHLIAAAPGALLCVPQVAVIGDLRQVLDACPVPWDEVWALIDQPAQAPRADDPPHPLIDLLGAGWARDEILLGAGAGIPVTRWLHPTGARCAIL